MNRVFDFVHSSEQLRYCSKAQIFAMSSIRKSSSRSTSTIRGRHPKRGRGRGGKVLPTVTSQPDERHSISEPSSQTPQSLVSTDIQQQSTAQSDGQNTPNVTTESTTVSSAEYLKLMEAHSKLVESNNILKDSYNSMQLDLAQTKTTCTILQEKLVLLKNEISDLKQKNIGLQNLNKVLEMSTTKKTSSKFMSALSKSMDKRYISLAIAVDRRLVQWSINETMELIASSHDCKKRNWNGRMDIVSEFGIPRKATIQVEGDNQTQYFVPSLFSAVLMSTDLFFIHSFHSLESVIWSAANDVLDELSWISFCTDSNVRNDTLKVLSTNKILMNKLKQHLTDSVSNRKRSVKDELFWILKYFSLRSQNDRRKDVPLFTKLEEIRLAQQNLVHNAPSTGPTSVCNRQYNWWRTTDVCSLTSDQRSPNMASTDDIVKDRVDRIPEEPEDDSSTESSMYRVSLMGIHRNEISFHLWVIFLGYNPIFDMEHPTETTILSIARLDAWLATVVDLLVENNKRGGGRQRDYNNLFHTHFIQSTHQLVSDIFHFVKYWVPHELELCIEAQTDLRDHIIKMDREATVLLFSPSNSVYYIAVKNDWFYKFISPNMGIVHDCYIAKVAEDWKTIDMLSKDDIYFTTDFKIQEPPVQHVTTPVPVNDLVDSTDVPAYEYEDDLDPPLAPSTVSPLKLP